jgi:hypothetical protein
MPPVAAGARQSPIFINGHLRYLISIIGSLNPQEVQKAIIVDAEHASVLALFNNDTDSHAESKLITYLRTGHLDPSAIVTPEQVGQPGLSGSGGPTAQTTPVVNGSAGQIIDSLRKSNAGLAKQLKQQQAEIDALAKLVAGQQAGQKTGSSK